MANGQTTEIDYTTYANKAPTDLQERFPDWLIDKTGYEPSAAKTKDQAFRDGVRLATALRMDFQASPENRAATEARRAERAAEKAAPAAAAPAAVPAKAVKAAKSTRATKAAAAPVAEPATAAPAKATRGGRRGARPAAAATPDAPF